MTNDENTERLEIKQTSYENIHRVDFSCSMHINTATILACKQCVKEQLDAEYERGKADGQTEAKKEKT